MARHHCRRFYLRQCSPGRQCDRDLRPQERRRQQGLVVGYDTRFASQRAAEIVSEVLAASGIAVRLSDDYTPTPALSYAVKNLGAAGGVMITSSHNPFDWNGVKYKAGYGGSGTPAIMKSIEGELDSPRLERSGGSVTLTDFKTPYISAIKNFVDLKLIQKADFKFAIDVMYGAGRGVLKGIFAESGIDHLEIRGELNPLFPGINPEPIPPHIAMLQETVVRDHFQAGLATDGDADRLGAVAEDGSFVDAHKCFSVILEWLLKRKQVAGRDCARVQHHAHDRPHCREVRPQAARMRHRLQVHLRSHAGARHPDRRGRVRRNRHSPAPAGA